MLIFLTISVPIDTPYIKKNVIGGTADMIWWDDASFRMDIPPESFTKGHNIDILVSVCRSHRFVIPKGYKLFSPAYEIRVSEKSQQPLTITLKHDVEEEAESFVILHRTDKGETQILDSCTVLNSSFIMFQLTELNDVAVAGPNNIITNYMLSFYRQNVFYDDNLHLKILALICQSELRHEVSYTI